MRYKVSVYRQDFERRTTALIDSSRTANKGNGVPTDVRDLTFQCSILQTSAAIEEYVRTVFEAWAFRVKTQATNSVAIPPRTRVAIAKKRLEQHFSSFIFNNDERGFLLKLEQERDLWPFLVGNVQVPAAFDGKAVYVERKFPSVKNVKVVFSRIGVDNIFDLLSALIRADAEFRLDSFNSIRTALAHANPPQLTFLDVKRNIEDMQGLVRAMDRVVHKSLSTYLGASIW